MYKYLSDLLCFVAFVSVNLSAFAAAATRGEYIQALQQQGIKPGNFLGEDAEGVPLLCGEPPSSSLTDTKPTALHGAWNCLRVRGRGSLSRMSYAMTASRAFASK